MLTNTVAMCLGFEVDPGVLKEVTYGTARPTLPIPPNETDVNQLLFYKYRGWRYEEEWRGWIRVDDRDDSTGLYFYPFDGSVQLREVIAGPLCDLARARIEAALKGYRDPIRIIKARLAFRTFRVVANLRGFAD